MIRLSSAGKPDTKTNEITPGLAIKFLRDSVPSGNLIAMPGIEAQKSMNFFLHDFVNHIPKPSGAAFNVLAAKFLSYSNFIFELGLSDLSKYDQSGLQVNAGDMDFPWRMRL